MRVKLSIPIHSIDLADYLKVPANEDFKIEYISTDSREIQSGDLFIPLCGQRFNGYDFIPEAESRGARILAKGYDIGAEDTSAVLLKIAGYYKTLLTKLRTTVAITGSVGKTTTKEFSAALISNEINVHTNKGNQNNEIGVPLTVLSAPKDTEVLILECGTNHRGELSRISRSIKPDVAVITNIGTAHIGNFGSRRAIAEAKLEICDGMCGGILLCEAGDPFLTDAPGRMTVSTNGPADFSLTSLRKAKGGCLFDFNSSKGVERDIFIPVKEKHLMPAIAYALAVGVLCGVGTKRLKANAKEISNACLRHRYIDCGSYTLLDDSYNASLESTKAALDMLRDANRPTSALLGDILELGDYAEEIHKRIGEYARDCGLSRLYLMGKYSRFIAEGAISAGLAPSNIFISQSVSPTDMAKIIECSHEPHEIILVKASHRSDLSRVINILKEGKQNNG